jgi:hypothetical protein
MRRFLSVAALLAAVLLLSGPGRAADSPYAGTWKVLFMPPGGEQALFLVKVETSAATPKIEMLSSGIPGLKEAKFEVAKPTGDALAFTVEAKGIPTLKFNIYTPKGEKEPKKLLGSIEIRGDRFFARLERTEDKELDPKTAGKQAPEAKDYVAAMQTKDAKERETALKHFVEKNAESLLASQAQLDLVGLMPANGGKADDVKATAEKVIKFAATYGPEMKDDAVAKVARKLVFSKKSPALAVEYARLVEKALPEGATTAQRTASAKLLFWALQQTDKKDEIKAAGDRVAGLDKILDDEYLKDAVPFKTETITRDGAKGRVVLVELFTGAYCPPCVAADVAFDAALKTYKPQDVLLIQYHEHIPAPDRLTNEDTEERAKFYDVEGVPSTHVNGGADLGLGGAKEDARDAYTNLLNAIKDVETGDAPPKIKLAAEQKGDNVVITAEVADLKDASANMKLRLALVQESVHYPGGNGQRFHHHVVRAMPGGVKGFELAEATAKQQVKVNLADLKKSLIEHMEKSNESEPFVDLENPIELKDLKVVAFIQNDKTKSVLQAAAVDVQPAK